MKRWLFLSLIVGGILSSEVVQAQRTTQKSSKQAAATKPGMAAWTPEVQQYLGVQQGSFGMVGLNRLSKAQLDALVNAAKENITGDPRKHMLTCGPAAPAQAGKVRVLITVSGDDPAGQRATEIRQAIGAVDGVEIVDASSAADRALHVVIQEQTLGKRTIGYTASYMTATPCTDESRKTDAELKGQLGTYTDPKGVDLATDLARMFQRDLQEAR
ncbi:hypothetical protein [Edaphobacter modestus]|uniref:Uncharacterized protein n=1 Tax=Edaphobacter modestus TaxID=388466 RepID=A0A4Q7YXF3_9BACT|nr:hypothetical protein [Edaphobacter modestus]RZU42124.1 hypothetical protein BDD14_3671 [Edaphobacter modestus]